MSIQKRTIKETEVSTEIDVKELLGGISKDRDVREAFFQVMIDRLVSRLDEGRNFRGNLFPGKGKTYSQEYKDSLAFKAFNKSDTVNMQLTGDMLASVEIQSQNENKIKVGVSSDQAPKAYNHQTGDTVPKREWFGWTDEELKSIAKEFRPIKDEGPTISDEKITNLLDRLLGNG